MAPSLTQILRPELRLTPLQVLSLRLLAHPVSKLEEAIEDALDENYPFLERVDAPALPTDEEQPAAPAAADRQPEPPAAPGDEPDAREPDLWRRDERTPVATEAREPLSLENFSAAGPSLSAHLLEQLGHAARDEEARFIGEALIGNLDDNGYLRAELGEIAEATGTSLAAVERALALVQALDPAGVAARSPSECLALQLRADPEADPIALAIVERHCDALAGGRLEYLARVLRVPMPQIQAAVERIRRLDPKPGRAFGPDEARPVKPEVTIEKLDGEYVVRLNDNGLPMLRVRGYRGLGAACSAEERRFLTERRQAARWFVEAIEHRRQTLRSVVETMVRLQRDFFDHGPHRLRPLTLRQVADEIPIHESTVSRAISAKYADTPHGVFSLKHFFAPGIALSHGGLVATAAVKTRLRALIAGEDGAQPLSDLALAIALREHGFVVARRTVAKYRDEFAIPPCHRRRRTPGRGSR
jgi:RNA polymerase sigma-54 factor